MKKRWILSAALVLALMTMIEPIAVAEMWGKEDAEARKREAMAGILGSNPATWRFSGAASSLVETNGVSALVTDKDNLWIRDTAAYEPGMEYTFTFRLRPAAAKTAAVTFRVAETSAPDTEKRHVGLLLNMPATQDRVNYAGFYLPHCNQGKDSPVTIAGGSHFPGITIEPSLSWPKTMRARIEAQIANKPDARELSDTVRIAVEADHVCAWLNGRLLRDVRHAGLATAGHMAVQISPGVELLAVRAHPLAPLGRFEEVPLDGHVNARVFENDAPIERGLLPETGRTVRVDTVPFRFPSADSRGNDHVDVGESWCRFGGLAGYFDAITGPFGGRWNQLDCRDPSRIQIRVPGGQYKALHLIAASDSEEDSVPIVTAQFFRPSAGHPRQVEAEVPAFSATASTVKGLPVRLANGRKGRLYHVTIPLDPDMIGWFSDLDAIGLELTKKVQFFRAYPDPCEYSWHGAGLPSSVHVYAATLERPEVEVTLIPRYPGHVWTAPEQPSFDVELRNFGEKARAAELTFSTEASDGSNATMQTQTVQLPSKGTPVKAALPLKLTRYGLHHVKLAWASGSETGALTRHLAFLHPDTRERGDWQEGRGSVFGYWGYTGPGRKEEMRVMAAAGAELDGGICIGPETEAYAKQFRMFGLNAFNGHAIYRTAFNFDMEAKYDPKDPEKTGAVLIAELKKMYYPPSAVSRSEYLPFFPEPYIGPLFHGSLPQYYGEPEYQLNEADQASFQPQLTKFLIGARAVRKTWPDVKIVLPHGDPLYTVPFLHHSKETRDLIDGIGLDMPLFERLPESQVHQVVLHRLWQVNGEFKRFNKKPYYVLAEGFCISAKDPLLSLDANADLSARDFLHFIAYGVNRFPSANGSFDCNNYWGENHYGGGFNAGMPVADARPPYVAYATLTRHINRKNFVKWIPTGSTSVYCLQFQHYKTGALTHVLWTVRGTRPVTIPIPGGATVTYFDESDNPVELKPTNGTAKFTIDGSPCYVEGLANDMVLTLGEPDHSDSKPGPHARKLANLGDGSWKIVAEHDAIYENNHPFQIKRYLGNMSAARAEAPADQGGKALALRLGRQERDPKIMPFYTTLVPSKPVTIPGKASHLGLWAHASSDWGRMIYDLRDARGERWISIGTKEQWNCDDIHQKSSFCFDGWRYLTFELPSHAPYDTYREDGTTWWGSHGGDGVVDLPLKLTKILVERRTDVMYVNQPVPAANDDVLLGDLCAEYASSTDATDEAVRLSRLRMPIPKDAPALENPIAGLARTGTLAPTRVVKVTDPAHQYDGTRCHVHFESMAGAKTYDVWVSPYADGRGALQLGAGWTESGQLINGLCPETTFYAFVVWKDAEGHPSKPSQPFKFTLKDLFPMK